MNVCPEEIRVKNRRKALASVRRTKEYKDRQKVYTFDKVCIWCGKGDHLLIHHTDYSDYDTPEIYIRTLDKGWVMCTRCHEAYHHGRILCPVCKEVTTKYERCYRCLPQGRKDEIEHDKERKKRIKRDIEHARYQRYKRWKDGVTK